MHFAQVIMYNNNVKMCNNDVIMVLCYYVFLCIIDSAQDAGQNTSSAMG